MQTATPYLETLNPEQRRAVEHGPAGGLAAPPLLVIAGAGSGKTNTLAHRVAHLIVQGADPRRILLMTFSRRAASEMIKRVERIARKVLGDNAGIMTDALMWAGTLSFLPKLGLFLIILIAGYFIAKAIGKLAEPSLEVLEVNKYIEATIEADVQGDSEAALLDIYRKIRPGDPATSDSARNLLQSIFYDPRRYDMAKVGRYKMNKKLGSQLPLTARTLTTAFQRA